ncbi:MAG: hypothetical protein JXB35_01620 [Anaerolineae bacterium]|nr:hypothetical protein [Anaerolineae bacterium]
MTKALLIVLGVVAGLGVLGWTGLHIKPAPFKGFPQAPGPIETMPLPSNLPAPVARFFHQIYGDRIPQISSAVISGRAMLRPVTGFPAFPSRFRFTHNAGQDYRHYIEITMFGLPLIKGNEHFLEGKGHLDLGPIGVSEGPHIDQAGALGLWAESVWLPAIWITDPRLRWEAVDDATAILAAPFGKEEEHLILRFDPQTGKLHFLEAMRYRNSLEEGKILWICEALDWTTVAGYTLPAQGHITWFDEGTAWAKFDVEDIVYNVEIQDYITQTGP